MHSEPFAYRLKQAVKILLRGEPQRVTPIPHITKEEAEEAHSFFPMNKFFLTGHSRSGTTLLARLIRLHPDVHCDWQGHFFSRPPLLRSLVDDPALETWLTHRSFHWNRGVDPSAVLVRACSDYLLEREARRNGKSIVGDKSPNTYLGGECIDNIHQIYPDAYIIHIVRDGRDALLSHQTRRYIEKHTQLSPDEKMIQQQLKNQPNDYFQNGGSLFPASMFTKRTQSWVNNINETEDIGLSLYQERYLRVHYEALLEDPFSILCQIWSFLKAPIDERGLEEIVATELNKNPDASWQKQNNPDIARLFTKGESGGWQKFFTPSDRLHFKQIAGATLIRFGYEKDTEW